MPRSVFTDAYVLVAERLSALRGEYGVSQIELATRLGKSQQFVSAIERRVRRLDIVEFFVVVRAIGADPVKEVTALYRSFAPEMKI